MIFTFFMLTGRSDRIGRAADFTTNSWGGGRQQYKDNRNRRYDNEQNKNEEFQYKVSLFLFMSN